MCKAPLAPQRRDLVIGAAELAQDLIGMLADRGRVALHTRGRAGEAHRLRQHLQFAEMRRGHLRRHAEMPHLRIGEHLVDGIDRPAGQPASLKRPIQVALASPESAALISSPNRSRLSERAFAVA